MNKGLVGLGLIGAIIVLVGVFTPWARVNVSSSGGMDFDASASITGWNLASGGEIDVSGLPSGHSLPSIVETELSSMTGTKSYPYLAFAGGILALVGAIGAFASQKAKLFGISLAIGGILAIISCTYGYFDTISELKEVFHAGLFSGLFGTDIEIGIPYGIYLGWVGGVLSLIGAYGTTRGKTEAST